ncbi:hypothetical protein [Tessaracoccus coleopterorum]|uniref:hypothetical protein n=1 Tax=Tessaracoccus coleopterorum TaxID=2714950 RepID=UPI0018D28B11|nr:hypothetical protein [Tessaracoccus coleopterorum]
MADIDHLGVRTTLIADCAQILAAHLDPAGVTTIGWDRLPMTWWPTRCWSSVVPHDRGRPDTGMSSGAARHGLPGETQRCG